MGCPPAWTGPELLTGRHDHACANDLDSSSAVAFAGRGGGAHERPPASRAGGAGVISVVRASALSAPLAGARSSVGPV
jgi:hypothetical protein